MNFRSIYSMDVFSEVCELFLKKKLYWMAIMTV